MPLTSRAAILAGLLLGAPLAAQEDASAPPDIVVTGKRPSKEQVRDFVRALTPAPPSGSIPRFIDQVCPFATGLAPVQNARIVTRIRQVAAAVGLDVAKPGCAPNAFVVVTRDKRAFIEGLAEKQPDAFAALSMRQVRKLARTKGPAAAWQLAGPVDTNGTPLRFDETLGTYVNDTTEAASRLRSPSHIGFDASILVVEAGTLEGLTATQLADYAAMRLFARLDPARLPPDAPPTILTILEAPMGSALPITMTAWDAGLLRGLYSASSNLNAQSQRSQISRQVNEDLDKQ
ncbi:MAG TPA: hypothetical protein VHM92_08300 [Allosphingosinicella sp.]|nr:hypothetical protein [Allosphingosinicella sp.]